MSSAIAARHHPALVSKAVRWVGIGATTVAAAALLIELAVVLVSITGRTLLGHGPLWSDEASRLALSIIAFIGGAAAYRGAHHTAIRLITDRLGTTARQAVGAGIEWLVLIVCVATAWQSIGLLTASWDNVTPILQISTGWITLPLTIGLLLIALFALERLLIDYTPRMAAITGLVMGAGSAWAGYAAGAPGVRGQSGDIADRHDPAVLRRYSVGYAGQLRHAAGDTELPGPDRHGAAGRGAPGDG